MAEAVKKLSPEIKDLLNRIFVIDASRRVTIKQIERHPWYNKPVEGKFAEKLKELEKSQAELNKYFSHKVDDDSVKERNRKIEELVERATTLPDAEDDEIVTIDLRDHSLEELRQQDCQQQEPQEQV